MGKNSRHDDDHHDWNNDHDWNDDHDEDHDEHGWDSDSDHGDHGHDDEFEFELPDSFKLDLSDFNLKSLGKITDFDVGRKHLSVTIGDQWTISVDGSGFDFTLKGSSKLPIINGGTIDSFTVDGPGKADFSISGLDMSAKAFSNALRHLDGAKLLDLVLGGDETISGSGFGDYLFAGKGNDHILGNGGNDWLMGGAGNDVIGGGKGNDYLSGGSGADTFVFAPSSKMDLIADFNADQDVLDLSAFGITDDFDSFIDDNVSRSRCHGEDDEVVINLGNGDMVKLDGVSRWDLNDQNVLL